MAAGNARANLKNKGAAPEADLIVVETNFNLPNWTLTIADACDYIFKVADSLGKPAVINISLGDYLGSHDGNDPAADLIESLLDLSPGRIVVSAAGNAGNQGKFHVRNNSIGSDTTFFWNIPNTGMTVAGPNKIVFDLWSDTADAHYYFAYGADKISPNYSFRGNTSFRFATSNMNQVPVTDTLFNANGQRIAIIDDADEHPQPEHIPIPGHELGPRRSPQLDTEQRRTVGRQHRHTIPPTLGLNQREAAPQGPDSRGLLQTHRTADNRELTAASGRCQPFS
jgi:hypothetical protein